jgi:hypothetical protein
MSRLMLEGKARSLPYRGVPERYSARLGYCLTRKHYTRLERLARDKYTTLLRPLLNYGHRKFYNIECRFKIEINLKSETLGATVAQW